MSVDVVLLKLNVVKIEKNFVKEQRKRESYNFVDEKRSSEL